MKTLKTKQVNINVLESISEFDLLITASGYESRASFFIENIKNISFKKKLAFGFNEYSDNKVRLKNDEIFKHFNFLFFYESTNSSKNLIAYLNETILKFKSKSLKIVIDYSCMSRVWYASILSYFKNISEKNNCKIELYFSYSPALFVQPPASSVKNTIVGPIDGFSNIYIPLKTVALIIGLGFEKERAYGLSEYFNAISYYFYGDESYNSEYSKVVNEKNKKLLDNSIPDNIFKYPINDLNYTETMLIDLCNSLSNNHKIILAPCGPKIFTLICLIVSMKLKDIDVWRISPGSFAHPFDKKPNGDLLIYNIVFQKNY